MLFNQSKYIYIYMWHVSALGWISPCLSYDVPTRCPSYFWWIMMNHDESWWIMMNHDESWWFKQPESGATQPLGTGHEQSQHGSGQIGPVQVDAIQGLHCRTSAHSAHSAPGPGTSQYVTTLPHIHFGRTLDPSSHSTDGELQTGIWKYWTVYLKNHHFFFGFYSSTCLHGLEPFSAAQHPLHQVLIVLEFSPGKWITWWRDMHSDWPKRLSVELATNITAPWVKTMPNLRMTPGEIATDLQFVRYINVVLSFSDIVQSRLASTFGAPLERQPGSICPCFQVRCWCSTNASAIQ